MGALKSEKRAATEQTRGVLIDYGSPYHCWGTVKQVLISHSKRRPKIGFQDQLSLNTDQKYCRMLQGSANDCHEYPLVFGMHVSYIEAVTHAHYYWSY